MKRLGELLRHSLVYAMANGLQRLTGFLLIPLYTRVLVVESYGMMEILATLTNATLILATCALPSAFNKCFHRDCTTELDRQRMLGTAVWLLSLAATVTVAVGILFAETLAKRLLGDIESTQLVILALISTATFAIAQVPLMLLRARESSILYSLLSLWQFLSMLSLNVVLVGRFHLGVRGVLLGSIGASAAVLIVSLPLLLSNVRPVFSSRLAKALLKFGLPMVPVGVGAWVMNVSDRWMLEMLASREVVGLYGLGYRFGMLVEVLLVVPFQLAWPAFYFKEASNPEARQLYGRVLTWYVLVGGFITLMVSLGGELGLRLMSEPSYWEGARVIPLVATAYFLNGFQYCVAPGVHLGGKTHVLPAITLVGAIANVVLNFAWIPRYGMMGAAGSTFVAFLVLGLLTALVSYRAYGFQFEVLKIASIAAFMIGLGLIGLMIPADTTQGLVISRSLLMGIALLSLTAWCVRELRPGWLSKRLESRWRLPRAHEGAK